MILLASLVQQLKQMGPKNQFTVCPSGIICMDLMWTRYDCTRRLVLPWGNPSGLGKEIKEISGYRESTQ